MTTGDFITVAVGVGGAVGAVALFAAGFARGAVQRARRLRLATWGFAGAGLVRLLGALAGWGSELDVACGVLLLVLGTGITVAPVAGGTGPKSPTAER